MQMLSLNCWNIRNRWNSIDYHNLWTNLEEYLCKSSYFRNDCHRWLNVILVLRSSIYRRYKEFCLHVCQQGNSLRFRLDLLRISSYLWDFQDLGELGYITKLCNRKRIRIQWYYSLQDHRAYTQEREVHFHNIYWVIEFRAYFHLHH